MTEELYELSEDFGDIFEEEFCSLAVVLCGIGW